MKIMAFVASVTIVFSSCDKEGIWGNGSIKTEERTLNAFTKVSVEGSTQVHIIRGEDFDVAVKAYANILPHLKTKVDNGILTIKFENSVNVKNDNSEVFITMPVLNGLHTSGSGDIDVKGNFVATETFNAGISGSADISIENATSDKLKVSIAGSGDFKSFGFNAKEADIQISGSGNVELTVSEKLVAKIRGSGNIYYKNNPAIDADISGSGKLVKK